MRTDCYDSSLFSYDVLCASRQGRHEDKDDPTPFVKYLLGVIETRIGKFNKAEFTELCPNLSFATVERLLKTLYDAGEIVKKGSGRATYYVRLT